MNDSRTRQIGPTCRPEPRHPADPNRPHGAPLAARAVAIALAMMIGACQQDDPPPAPEVAVAPPSVPPPPAPARRVVRLAWSFDVAADRCIATASDRLTTLTVTVSRNAAVGLILAFPAPEAARITARSSAKFRFKGPSGTWSLRASGDARHGIGAFSAADEIALGRVLILLGGGTLDVAVPPPALPSVLIPAAGPEAQDWSDCARRQVI